LEDLKTALHKQFSEIAPQLSFPVSQQQQDKLIDFVLLLYKWNKTYNLSSVRQPSDMLVKHIFDSIVISPFLEGSSFADVGTGPGLPGIPLAIMHPEKSFTLIDSLGKRVRFMNQAIHELKLNNAIPIQSRVEDIKADQLFDGVLSRAFASLDDMLHWCKHLIAKDGLFLALKGQLNQDELDQIPSQFTLVQSIPLLIPSLTGDRHLVKIKMSS
jgi:16S rRNA (guanine527-N7)-methyltransferase